MKKLLLYSFCLFALGISGQVSLPLSSVITPGNYTAQQEVKLLPGMQGLPSGSNQMHLYIDPSISAPTPYTSAGTLGTPPVNYALDLSKPVGAIPYNYDVTPLGSAMCSIPIDVPMGTNNLKPNISLTYNSNPTWGP